MSSETNTAHFWPALGAIASSAAVVVALFGERIRRWMFGPKIELQEFNLAVPDQREGVSKHVRFHHYVEIINKGDPLEEGQAQLLAVKFHPGRQNKELLVRLPSVTWPLGNHIAPNSSDTRSIVYREVLKIGEITAVDKVPKLPVELEPRHNPLSEDDGDPHFRARFYFQIIGKNYRSDVWPMDFVRDTIVTSNWRVEVMPKESEKSFWPKIRNYVREHNQQKRKEGLP